MSGMSIFIIIAVAVVLSAIYLYMTPNVNYAIGVLTSYPPQKKEVLEDVPKPYFGDYYKYFYCPDCGEAVYDRAIKNVECCKKCGSEKITKTVGRWEFEWQSGQYFNGYKGTKFHPIVPHKTTEPA